MTSSFGLAPVKREGQKIRWEEYANPHPHPRWVSPPHRSATAREHFAWELMSGSDVEKLKQDPYWKYFEEDEHA